MFTTGYKDELIFGGASDFFAMFHWAPKSFAS